MLATTPSGMMPPEEPRTRSADKALGADADALPEIGALERRIEEGEAELAKFKSQKSRNSLLLILGTGIVICIVIYWGLTQILVTGLSVTGVAPLVYAVLMTFSGLHVWRILRERERERQLRAALEESRYKKFLLEVLSKEEE